MIKKIDITDPVMAEAVLSVQIPSYRAEAELINFSDLPPLEDTVETLLRCEESFYGYYCGEELCGVISFKTDKSVLDIHRLTVHPNYFRKGIAQKLLVFIESRVEGIDKIIVSTGSKNEPAVCFYEKNGFLKMEELEVNEYLSLTFFEKTI